MTADMSIMPIILINAFFSDSKGHHGSSIRP